VHFELVEETGYDVIEGASNEMHGFFDLVVVVLDPRFGDGLVEGLDVAHSEDAFLEEFEWGEAVPIGWAVGEAVSSAVGFGQ